METYTPNLMPKVAIIGAGNVGGTIALNLLRKQITNIVLVDIDLKTAQGKAMDLDDFQSSIDGSMKIKGTNDYSHIKNSDIVVIAAGRARKKGENITREELFEINSSVIREVSAKIKENSPGSIIITVTNPVDKMNLLVLNEVNGDRKKIIGAGNLLDTARLKTIIAKELNIPVSKVETIVKGPHNNDMLPVFSCTKVNGKAICEVISSEKLEEISQKVKSRGKSIVDLMGSGYYTIGNVVASMAESVLLDKKNIIPASINLEGEYGIHGISLGVPIKLGKEGAEVIEVEFSEKNELLKAAEKIR